MARQPNSLARLPVKKTAKVTSLTVGSQSELEKALKNKNVRKITVATQGAVTFTVPQGNYSKVDLVINAAECGCCE